MVECAQKRNGQGFTLVEVMVALGLIAVSLMLVLGLIPAGIQSAQRAADVQAAAAWSRQLIEEAPLPTKPTLGYSTSEVFLEDIGSTHFNATRTIRVSGDYLCEIATETTWHNGVEPVRLSLTRYNPAGPPTPTPSPSP